jgi:hypothetical protein
LPEDHSLKVPGVLERRPQASWAVCHAGRVATFFDPHLLHRSRWPTFGTKVVSGRASTLTSADRLQVWQVAITARTPFSRMFRSDIGGPGLVLIV